LITGADAITGPAYISALREHDVRKIRWDAKTHVRQHPIVRWLACPYSIGALFGQECRHEYTDESFGVHHVVFYPCLQFLYDRLELFAKYGVGVGIWELGQGENPRMAGIFPRSKQFTYRLFANSGLEYFFDLL
jgi:hypothetical protein